MQEQLIIAQITDTHIVQKGKHWHNIKEVNTAERLMQIIDDLNNRIPRPNLVIHTGDIVQRDNHISSYIHAKELFDKLTIPYYLTCGNHDNFLSLKSIFKTHNYFEHNNHANFKIELGSLDLIIMDSQVENESYGLLSNDTLTWLENILTNSSNDKMLFMHHYPINVQSPYASSIKLHNYNILSEMLLPQDNIKGVFCGHYHFGLASIFANTLCWISQSSAPTHIVVDDKCIGYNLSPPSYSLHYYKNHMVTSRIINVTDKVTNCQIKY